MRLIHQPPNLSNKIIVNPSRALGLLYELCTVHHIWDCNIKPILQPHWKLFTRSVSPCPPYQGKHSNTEVQNPRPLKQPTLSGNSSLKVSVSGHHLRGCRRFPGFDNDKGEKEMSPYVSLIVIILIVSSRGHQRCTRTGLMRPPNNLYLSLSPDVVRPRSHSWCDRPPPRRAAEPSSTRDCRSSFLLL